MSSLVMRARAYRQSEHFTRLWKFASVSVISTCVTQSVLFLTYHELSLASAMECNVLATAVSTVPAYYLNRTWTWGKRGKSSPWREVLPFWIIAFVGLVLSTIAVGIAAHNADRISSSRDVRTAVVQFANLVTYAFIWLGRYFIFNKYLFGEHTHETAAPEATIAGVGSLDEAAPAILATSDDAPHYKPAPNIARAPRIDAARTEGWAIAETER